ncbi:hypothetical protein CBW65_06110 [Tumebacillus avium]|uniref:HEPN domain-containing protein n=1 Tax=Tumebacillus avium TaxID=1903704 RepID=A0A1Y0ILK3_9BACL|nr:hypothetical protein [Tumebacillus avium]ARU60706.1 hypothetical protein CBW65_06110 [Tumebacillus avium]
MKYEAKDIYNTANSFLAASNALNQKLSETNDVGTYIAPIITNAAFSIELYLKCIYLIENKKPAPNIHQLDKLYKGLSDESKAVIEVIYNVLIIQSGTDMAMKEKVPETNLDLDSVLKGMSSAFINWRYSFEKRFTGFAGSGPLINALKSRIKILEPGWEH